MGWQRVLPVHRMPRNAKHTAIHDFKRCKEAFLVRKHLLPGFFVLALLIMAASCGPREAGELPPIGFKVEFESQTIPQEMRAGERITAQVRVKNISPLTWPSKPNHKNKNAVTLSYHWLSGKGDMLVFDGLRTALPNDLNAGDSVELTSAILAPDKPGAYVLEMTLVQEGVAWFPEKDGGKINVPVSVVSANSTARVVPSSQSSEASSLNGAEKKSAKTKSVAAPEEEPKPKKSRREKKREAREKAEAEQEKKPQAKSPQPEQTAQVKPAGTWAVQVAAFTDASEAAAFARQLHDKGHDAYVVVGQSKGKSWHRVRVGRFNDRADAEKLQAKLKVAEKVPSSNLVKN